MMQRLCLKKYAKVNQMDVNLRTHGSAEFMKHSFNYATALICVLSVRIYL